MPTVVSARFEDLVAVGLRVLISDDPNLDLVAAGVPMDEVEDAIERHRPDVVLLNFGTLGSPGQVLQLHRRLPGHAHRRPRQPADAAECNQMLSFGATACLSKETEARDVLNAIHLASRGMHLLPRSAAAAALGAAGSRAPSCSPRARPRCSSCCRTGAHQRRDRARAARSASRPCARTRATSTASSASARAAS